MKKNQHKKEVDNINSQIQDYQTEITNLDIQIANANQQIEDSNSKLEKAQKEYESQQQMLEERIVALYELRRYNIPRHFTIIRKFNWFYFKLLHSFRNSTMWFRSIKRNRQTKKNEIETAKKEIEESKQTLTTKSKQTSINTITSKKNEKSTVVAQLSSQNKNYKKK